MYSSRLKVFCCRFWITAEASQERAVGTKTKQYANAGLLDSRRAQNIGIMMAHAKMPAATLKPKLLSVRPDRVSRLSVGDPP